MAMRGVLLSYETVRESCGKFGSHFAEELRRRNRRKLGSKWHLDEVRLKITESSNIFGGLWIRTER